MSDRPRFTPFRSALAALGLAASVASAGGPVDLPKLGSNLDQVNDWSTMIPFADLFKTSRPWISGNSATWQWDDGRPLDVDADGWVRSLLPNQVARTLMLVDDTTLRVGAGRWVVTYDGTGDMDYANGVTLVASAPGRDVIDIRAQSGGGLFLYIYATTPGNHIRDIRILPESLADAPETPTFHPDFLARLGSYRVLRFMDWGNTNLTDVAHWSDRPKEGDARWSTERGVPLEIMCDLASETCSEPWFNIPHLADDDYIRQAAELIHARLVPGLRVWVEHSNETWNGIFDQAWYVQEQGLAAGLSTNAWQAGWFWHSRRSVRIFEIFSEVFGGERELVRVMGGFVTVPWGNEQALEFEDAYLHVDVLAIAPYFGHEWGTDNLAQTRNMTVNQLLNAIRTQSVPATMALVTQNKQLAEQYGVGLVAYEGGHHLNAPQLGYNDAVHAKFHAAARHATMGQIYSEYLAQWRAITGSTFVNFTLCGRLTPWGCWSVLEWITQPATPREQALIAFGADEPAPGCGLSPCPADLDGDRAVGPLDLGRTLSAWGSADPVADLDDNGVVDGADLFVALAAWGPCPG
jgi:hypothetical protein